jgi:transposase
LQHEHAQIAHALGGATGARRCQQQAISTSRPTLLHTLRQPPPTSPPAPTVVSIDDWAWGTRQSMGTIVVDLERRQTIALLADDREATVAFWLKQHPSIQIVCCDRSRVYANAITAGAQRLWAGRGAPARRWGELLVSSAPVRQTNYSGMPAA